MNSISSIIFVSLIATGIQYVLSAEPTQDPSVYKRAYPGIVADTEGNRITLTTGEVFTFDDGKAKDFDELIEAPDMEDQLSQQYPLGDESFAAPIKNFDPGRIRNEAFFKAVYGASKQEVAKNLVPVIWMPQSSGQTVMISKVNGANTQLEKISKELDALPDHFKKFLLKIGGTFNWRPIAGTNRLSTHSYGIAIDINPDMSSYWRWDKVYSYNNKIPREIVEIFERNGYIWGGKWYHYDTMHFEYRPELLPTTPIELSNPKQTKKD